MIRQLISRAPVIVKSVLKTKLDATEQLQQDHMKVETLFMQIKVTRDKKRRQGLFDKIKSELDLHIQIEESVFYAACEKFDELKSIVNESYEEHKQVKTLLKDMAKLSASNDTFDAKLTVLIEDVLHHVREEENNFFPKVRREMSPSQLERLGGQLRSLKNKKEPATEAAA